MSTIHITNSDNIKDPNIAKRINVLLKRIGEAVKKASVSVTDYNADPVEFVYTFSSNIEAVKYQNDLSTLETYSFQNNVIGNEFYEYRPVSSLPGI